MEETLIDELLKQLESGQTQLAAISSVRQMVTHREVRSIREAAQVTQAELAKTVGCSPSAIAQWELGARIPAGSMALAYAYALAACVKATR